MHYKLILENQSIQLLNDTMEYCFVNGRRNDVILNQSNNHGSISEFSPELQKISADLNQFNFLKVEVNNFVSKPK